jgi:hypothetical protein
MSISGFHKKTSCKEVIFMLQDSVQNILGGAKKWQTNVMSVERNR